MRFLLHECDAPWARPTWVGSLVVWLLLVTVSFSHADETEEAIKKQVAAISTAFDKQDAATLADLFLPEGEMISEDGTIYKGRDELTALFKSFFERFPGAKVTLVVESIRAIGPVLAIEEGSRTITTSDGESRADLRYAAVWSKVDGKWKLASTREVTNDSPPTQHAILESLDWMMGEWVNEGDDAAVQITYRWSEDGNYILGDFEVSRQGKKSKSSTQRIGWDPAHQMIRSWWFDADGGFSEGEWVPIPDGWLVKSSAVLPTGETGTATLRIVPSDEDRFTIKGTDRLIGGVLNEDFELVLTKRPAPSAGSTPSKGNSDATK